jgi:hypothetical protein
MAVERRDLAMDAGLSPVLVPIQTDDESIYGSAAHWSQFLPSIAARSGETVEGLIDQVLRREVQPILIWDPEAKKAMALCGVQYVMLGTGKAAILVWMAGRNRNAWQHLIADLEQYLRQNGCVEVRPLCRPGWAKLLQSRGYKITHYGMEKKL